MTAEGSQTVERRLDEAIRELHHLGRQVEDLTRRLTLLERSATETRHAEQLPGPEVSESESVWSWLGQSRFLPRLAMVCFVLVLALVLRTLTSNGIIEVEFGVWLGVGYSAGLVAFGWRALTRQRHGRRVLPACGAVLMCTVVLEAFGPFEQLSAATASWILAGTMATVAALGIRYRAESLVAIAVLSCTVSALALGFPNLPFPHTASVLLVANLVVLAWRSPSLPWLPWTTFGMTLFFWLLWSFKLGVALNRETPVPEGLYPEWCLPFLAAFSLVYAAVAGLRTAAAPRSPGPFHVFLPTANVLWAYSAGYAVVVPWTGGDALLGLTGLAVSLAHFGIAGWLWHRERSCAQGITAFILAGTMLLVLAAPAALGSLLFALPVWSGAALGLAIASSRCRSAGLYLTSHLLQLSTCGYAISSGVFAVPNPTVVSSTLVGGTVTAIAVAHYSWTRRHPIGPGTWLARLDPRQRSPVLLLWIAAVNAFCFVRLPIWSGIEALGIDVENAFRGAQSVIINLSGIGLMLFGIARKDGHLLATAGIVALIGGLKVFGSDLLGGSGLPLVLAVFSFGLAAAMGSLVVGKWQAYTRQSPATREGDGGGPTGAEP